MHRTPSLHLIPAGALVALAMALACAAVGYADTARAARSCDDVGADYREFEGGSGLRITDAKGVTCRTARRLAKRCIRYRSVRGWTATDAYERTQSLSRGRKRIQWHGIAGGEPVCMTAVVRSIYGECGPDYSRGLCDRPDTFGYEFGTHGQARIDTWRRWGKKTAVGTGTFFYTDSTETFEVAVKILLTRKRPCRIEHTAYTRLTLRAVDPAQDNKIAVWRHPAGVDASC